jgi:protein-S-isoprenylcysteine O-methyltransferase Ste14
MRHVVAVVMLVSVPPIVVAWTLIHPFIRHWRKFGPVLTYLIVVPVVLAAMFGIYRVRNQLIRGDYGANKALIALGFVLMAASTWLFVILKRELRWTTMVGLPEIDPAGHQQKLITSGIYSRIRHPRYAEILLALLSCSLIANYRSVYLLFVVSVPAICLIAWLEERELMQRYGAEYEHYRTQVPMFIPRRGRKFSQQ